MEDIADLCYYYVKSMIQIIFCPLFKASSILLNWRDLNFFVFTIRSAFNLFFFPEFLDNRNHLVDSLAVLL